ncbi:alpha/beta fold hydrolase [Pseudochryseolinea flava]|uniref:Alpha/beta hydrolase n=1 Tax=Pseudochryseolinea flava TaxID=2059302 RepID=A0A364Y8K7_9BACT|nr:alpha/beta fold hydrolase [Pseudochryseolinea flava]RAW03444.1 alpha/beta hydrolase [Pseudochryseolinea flava]
MNPILLLHGALGTREQLVPIESALQQSGYTTMSLNFSGHGQQPFSQHGFHVDVFAEEIMSFLNHHDLSFVDVFGYSMGGYVALTAAAQWPARFRKIVTLGTKFDWSPVVAQAEVQKLDPEKILTKIPQFADLLKQLHGDSHWKLLLEATANMMSKLGSRPTLDENTLGAIQQEVLVLAGDKDNMAPANVAEQVAQQIPFGSFQQLPNTPHPIERVNLEALMPLLRNFFV